MKDKITILTTTHVVSSIGPNHERKGDSVDLISESIADLYTHLPELSTCRHVISLDHAEKIEKSKKYLHNLTEFIKYFENIELIISSGMYESIRNLITSVRTPYYLWFEHDWKFVKEIDIKKLISLFEEHEHINYIKFNKRSIIKWGVDSRIYQSKRVPNLVVTNGWSNNPYLARTSFYKDFIIPYMDEHRKNSTIEMDIQNMYRADIKEMGEEKAEEKWGIYILGKLGEDKYVEHINGRTK